MRVRWVAENGSGILSDEREKTFEKKLNIFKQLISQGRQGDGILPNAEAHEACKEEVW